MFSNFPSTHQAISKSTAIDPYLLETQNSDTPSAASQNDMSHLPESPPDISYIPSASFSTLRQQHHDDSRTATRQQPSFSIHPKFPKFYSLTEICGSPGIGKTQWTMFMCAKVLSERLHVSSSSNNRRQQQPDDNELQQQEQHASLPQFHIDEGFNILYVDTEGSFSVSRFKAILLNQLALMHPNVEIPQNVLIELANRLKLQRVVDLDQHLVVLTDLENLIKEESIKLVIYDSIAFFYRTETSSFEWQQLLVEHAQLLYQLCEELRVCIVLVNQVTTKIDQKRRAYFAPALGHTWSHLIAHRIFLYMTKDGVRKVGIWKSNYAPIQEFTYEIDTSGIQLKTEKGVR